MSDTTETESQKLQARLDKLAADKREAQERISALEKELGELRPKAEKAGALEKELGEARTAHEQARSEWNADRDLYGAGVTTPEGMKAVRALHAAFTEPDKDGKRPPLSEWLSARDKLPEAVRHYLPAQGAGATTAAAGAQSAQGTAQAAGNASGGTAAQGAASAGQGAAQGGRGLVDPNKGATAATGLGTSYTPEAIARMSSTEFAAHKDAILAQVGKPAAA